MQLFLKNVLVLSALATIGVPGSEWGLCVWANASEVGEATGSKTLEEEMAEKNKEHENSDLNMEDSMEGLEKIREELKKMGIDMDKMKEEMAQAEAVSSEYLQELRTPLQPLDNEDDSLRDSFDDNFSQEEKEKRMNMCWAVAMQFLSRVEKMEDKPLEAVAEARAMKADDLAQLAFNGAATNCYFNLTKDKYETMTSGDINMKEQAQLMLYGGGNPTQLSNAQQILLRLAVQKSFEQQEQASKKTKAEKTKKKSKSKKKAPIPDSFFYIYKEYIFFFLCVFLLLSLCYYFYSTLIVGETKRRIAREQALSDKKMKKLSSRKNI